MTMMYGIANCDTIKKAKRWLTNANISFDFYDYKKQSPNEEILARAIQEHGLEKIVNKRGTTYRKLDEATKQAIDPNNAIALLQEYSSMIKRPIIEHKGKLIVGFNVSEYEDVFTRD